VSEKLDKAVLQKNTCSAVIQNAIDYMEKHYQKKLSLEEVAENCYISPNYLSSLFSKEKNIRFSEYLIEIRLHHAVELLEDMKYSVAEIGQMVGYRDVGYFTQIFVKKYGITPAKYRKAK
jgi:two-component system response regulator YesN